MSEFLALWWIRGVIWWAAIAVKPAEWILRAGKNVWLPFDCVLLACIAGAGWIAWRHRRR